MWLSFIFVCCSVMDNEIFNLKWPFNFFLLFMKLEDLSPCKQEN